MCYNIYMDKWQTVMIAIAYHVPPDWNSSTDRTAFNRDMIEHDLYIQGYLYVEEAVKNTPKGMPLPEDIQPSHWPGSIV